jgi:hypothetical protein
MDYYGRSTARRAVAHAGSETAWPPTFVEAYARQAAAVRAQVNAVRRCLHGPGRLPAAFRRYCAESIEAVAALRTLCMCGELEINGTQRVAWEHCVRALLPSYLHMTNNRLGISVAEESYLAYLLARELGENPSGFAGAPA